MTSTTHPAPRNIAPVWTGTGLLLLTTLGSAWAARGGTQGAAMLSASVTAAGTLLMAWHTAKHVGVPRWAWFASAGLLAASAVLSVPLAADPAAWRDSNDMQWMFPWMFLLWVLTPPARTGACSPSHPRYGYFLLGASAFLAGLMLAAPRIAALF